MTLGHLAARPSGHYFLLRSRMTAFFDGSRLAGLALCWLAGSAVQAQSTSPAVTEAIVDPARISERVRREADRPYHWIRLQAPRAAPGVATVPGASSLNQAGRERSPRARTDEAPSVGAANLAAIGANRGTAVVAGPGAKAPGDSDTAASAGSELLLTMDQLPPAAGPAAAAPGALSTSASPAPSAEATGAASITSPAALDPAARPAAASLPTPDLGVPRPAEARTPGTFDNQLTLQAHVLPAFPSRWTQRLRRGQVEVQFEVNVDGEVRRVTAIKSSHPQLAQAAVDAVQSWRFAPINSPRDAIVTLGFDLDQ